MCGIVGFTGEYEAAPILLDGLKRLEYRGYDSAGIAVENKNKIKYAKVSGKIANLCEKTEDGKTLPGTCGIGHTRWATHGAPTLKNAHPHLSRNSRFAVVHNGIIENYAQLRKYLVDLGYKFKSDTDTEVVAHLLDHYYKGDFKTAVLKAASRLEGSYALGILCADHPGELFAVKEASPLIIGVGITNNYFASDVTALIAHTKNAIYLEDGEFAHITPENITVYNCAGKEIQKDITRISWDIRSAEKDGFDHFMLKEIMEEPRAVKATITPRIKGNNIKLDEFNLSRSVLSKINKIVITACGSAYYAGCSGKYVIEKLCGIPVVVELASELRYSDPLIDSHTLLIVLSQSGETADTIAALKECKSRGATVLGIVNVVGSTIAKLSDYVLYTWAGPEIAVATTKGYTTQLSILYLFALQAAKILGKITAAKYREYINDLKELPQLLQLVIDMNHALPKLAKKYHKSKSIFFIGRNTDYAIALEGSLKLKEISYIHAEAYAAGELKHGTIALIEDKTPVVALCCNEQLFDKMMSNIVEVKARGAKVLAVARKENVRIVAEADDVIFIPSVNPLFTGCVEIIPLQLFAYYVARENGCDIDKPKNLAKSVTVE